MGLFGARKKSGATVKRSSVRKARAEQHGEKRAARDRRDARVAERMRAERQQKIQQEARDGHAVQQRQQEQLKQQNKTRQVRADAGTAMWAQWSQRAMPLLALSLVLALIFAGWKLLDHVGSVPVSRVVFTGTLKHVDRNEMVSRVQPLLAGAGFMTVDIAAIRSALLAMPWIASVSVARSWPDQLVVAVTEQDPIARWGEGGLLSRSGDVFRPEKIVGAEDLPLLFGPDALAREVVSHYAELSDLLAAQGLKLASLGTDARGSWRAGLQGGVTLRLGSGDVLKKMQRFLRVYRGDLVARLDSVDYIDLRYSNGLAVGWK